jgi:hypothetical protein
MSTLQCTNSSSRFLSMRRPNVFSLGRALTLSALILPIGGCLMLGNKQPIPSSPTAQKANDVALGLTLPAATVDLKELGIRFYHPKITQRGVPVTVCFCNGVCTRWHDNHALSGRCGHAMQPKEVILIDQGIWDSKMRRSKHGRVISKVDRSHE